MRKSILGFDQEACVKLGLKLTDIMLLSWFQLAMGSRNMKHIIENDAVYLWCSYDKILQDLPVLDIKKDTLARRFNKLEELGLIEQKTYANTQQRGSRTFFAKTSLFDTLINNPEKNPSGEKDHPEKNPSGEKDHPEKNPSQYNKLINDNILDNTSYYLGRADLPTKKPLTNIRDIQKEILGKRNVSTPKKENPCAILFSMINTYTVNTELKNWLNKYLQWRLSKRGKINQEQWELELDSLKEHCKTDLEAIELVKTAYSGEYKNLVPVFVKTKKNAKPYCPDPLSIAGITPTKAARDMSAEERKNLFVKDVKF